MKLKYVSSRKISWIYALKDQKVKMSWNSVKRTQRSNIFRHILYWNESGICILKKLYLQREYIVAQTSTECWKVLLYVLYKQHTVVSKEVNVKHVQAVTKELNVEADTQDLNVVAVKQNLNVESVLSHGL